MLDLDEGYDWYSPDDMSFEVLTKSIPFSKVIWNGKVVYDEEGNFSSNELELKHYEFMHEYASKNIYEMNMKVVGFNCILDIIGDK